MTPVAWPATLQDKVNEANFGNQWGDPVIKSDMEVGPPKVRKRATRYPDTFTTSIELTVAQYTTLKDFFTISLNSGVIPFIFDHPITKVESTFRFAEAPSVRSLGGGYFRVNMAWEEVL